MGIYGALSTAVTGLRAQSFALENISGNIANSQTTGFKRIDTDFLDLIPDAPRSCRPPARCWRSRARPTRCRATSRSVSNETYMAINGIGFFVVEPTIGQSDGDCACSPAPTSTPAAAISRSTRAATWSTAPATISRACRSIRRRGNISGSVPQVLRISNAFLPAAADDPRQLPAQPAAVAQDGRVPGRPRRRGSELLEPQDFMTVIADAAGRRRPARGADHGDRGCHAIVARRRKR